MFSFFSYFIYLFFSPFFLGGGGDCGQGQFESIFSAF